MNLKGAEVESFLSDGATNVVGVLLYGPDGGLVSERARELVRCVAGSIDDPFQVVELGRKAVEADGSLIHDELSAISLTGGRRVVRIRDGGDGLSAAASSLEDVSPSGGLLVLEAGELPARSVLRKLFESAKHLAAIACYRDDSRSLPKVVRAALSEVGLTVAPDALAFLVSHMGGDRQITRRELEKLILYKDGQETNGDADGSGSETREVTLEDAMACIGDSAEVTLEDLCFAVGSGIISETERALERAAAEGAAAVQMIRAVARHFERLHQASAAVDQGMAPQEAVGKLRPPVFWKRKDLFERQAGAWSVARVRTALTELLELEIACKGGDGDPLLVAGRGLVRLSANAPRRRS